MLYDSMRVMQIINQYYYIFHYCTKKRTQVITILNSGKCGRKETSSASKQLCWYNFVNINIKLSHFAFLHIYDFLINIEYICLLCNFGCIHHFTAIFNLKLMNSYFEQNVFTFIRPHNRRGHLANNICADSQRKLSNPLPSPIALLHHCLWWSTPSLFCNHQSKLWAIYNNNQFTSLPACL